MLFGYRLRLFRPARGHERGEVSGSTAPPPKTGSGGWNGMGPRLCARASGAVCQLTAVWQLSAVDVASSYASAELFTSPHRNPGRGQTSKLAAESPWRKWPTLRLAGMCPRARVRKCRFARRVSQSSEERRRKMRFIGFDVPSQLL